MRRQVYLLTGWEKNIDIDTSDEILGFLMTVITFLRKEENNKQGHVRFLEYTAKVEGVEVNYAK